LECILRHWAKLCSFLSEAHLNWKMQSRDRSVSPPKPGPKAKAGGKEVPGGAILKAVPVIPTSLVTIGDEIGKGRFKKVHRGKHKKNDVVVLQYAKDESNTNELKILAHLSKPCAFVPEVYGVCNDRGMLIVVQELAVWGTLIGIIKSPDTSKNISPLHKLHFAKCVTSSMAHLQACRVVHADLSCRNVLVHRFEEDDPAASLLKVSDFGLSVLLPEGVEGECRRQPQPTRWCSPETIAECKLSYLSDVWTLGTVLWEMYSGGTAPWVKREKRADVAARLRDLAETGGAAEGGTDVSGDFPIQDGCPNVAHEAVLSCLKCDEKSRPTFVQLADVLTSIIERLESGDAGDAPAPVRIPSPVVQARTLPQETVIRVIEESDDEEDALPWNLDEDEDDADETTPVNFKSLKDVLKTPNAIYTFGEQTMKLLFLEMDAARAREEYLMDMVKKLQDRDAKSLLPGPRKPKAVPARLRSRQRLTSSTDRLSSVAPSVTRPRSLPRGHWTLWTFVGASLRRQDFAGEDDAWSAFDETTSHPCMLRDPSGAEAAARAWISSYFKLAPLIAAPHVSAMWA